MIARAWAARLTAFAAALLASRLVTPALSGVDAGGWLDGDPKLAHALADELIAFERSDDLTARAPPADRFSGEWALVTHQMTAIGLAQICLAHADEPCALAHEVTRAALKSFRPEMRSFGTAAWDGEEAMASLKGPHGHAYLAYPALALGMARLVDPDFPRDVARQHDALIQAYERRLLASNTGLIETYPGEAYPTDVAGVAAAIAVHGRATHTDHRAVLAHWAALVKEKQIDPASGFVIQRMDAETGEAHDAPRGSGTAFGAFYAAFADPVVARALAEATLRHESSFWGFGAIDEYGEGHEGRGDIDSGPVILGVSVTATGFGLAAARIAGDRAAFVRLFRTASLFGMPATSGDRLRFRAGGPIGNALLLAVLTSGAAVAK